MTRLLWGTPGSRIFETGLDRGVLYVGTQLGVPWSGLLSLTESTTGGASDPLYIDGEKIRNDLSPTEYAATLEAYSCPPEFAACDGLGTLAGGLFVDNQPRVPFGLSYRTLLGNDLKATDYGYKLHILYNALASPANRAYKSVSSSPDPNVLSWGISALPVRVAGRRASAHFVIDSTKTTAAKLKTVEDYMYGTASTTPKLPSAAQLIAMLQ